MNRRKFIQGAIAAASAAAAIPVGLAAAARSAPIIPSEACAAASVYGLKLGDLVSYKDGVYRVIEVIGLGPDAYGVRTENEFAWTETRRASNAWSAT